MSASFQIFPRTELGSFDFTISVLAAGEKHARQTSHATHGTGVVTELEFRLAKLAFGNNIKLFF